MNININTWKRWCTVKSVVWFWLPSPSPVSLTSGFPCWNMALLFTTDGNFNEHKHMKKVIYTVKSVSLTSGLLCWGTPSVETWPYTLQQMGNSRLGFLNQNIDSCEWCTMLHTNVDVALCFQSFLQFCIFVLYWIPNTAVKQDGAWANLSLPGWPLQSPSCFLKHPASHHQHHQPPSPSSPSSLSSP